MDNKLYNKCLAGVFGLITGDAVGVPYEFRSRNEMLQNPCRDMVGYGTYNKPMGTWSDDSSMVLATMDGVVGGEFDLDKIMMNFLDWQVYGKYTQDGFMFDIGLTTTKALDNYRSTLDVKSAGEKGKMSNGNGSLMRILPVVYYLYAKYGKDAMLKDEAIELVENLSALTHAHEISKKACVIYVAVGLRLLEDPTNKAIEKGLLDVKEYVKGISVFDRLYSKEFFDLPLGVFSGEGYVVDTLEASIRIAHGAKDYESGILQAVNLGNDTDTTAAVTGGLLGLKFGTEGLKKDWIAKIRNNEFISKTCFEFIKNITE